MSQTVVVNFADEPITRRLKRTVTSMTIDYEAQTMVVGYKEQSFILDEEDRETAIGQPVRNTYREDFATFTDSDEGDVISAAIGVRLALTDPSSEDPA